jgi:DNA-binding NtrC family response regulator
MSEESAFESRPKVFVVDDEPEIAKMLAVVLQMNLLDAIPYFDPAEALEAAKLSAPEYLISDIGMPGMSGIALGIAVRATAPGCKILLFSGQVDALEQIERAAEAGNRFELLQKPVLPQKLVEHLLAMAEHEAS